MLVSEREDKNKEYQFEYLQSEITSLRSKQEEMVE